MTPLFHPKKNLITADAVQALATMRSHLVQRKYDGELTVQTITTPHGPVQVLAEFMRPKSGGFFTASDRARFTQFPQGWFAALTGAGSPLGSLLEMDTFRRFQALQDCVPYFPANMFLSEEVQDVAAVLADGAEGVCAHAWGAAWGVMDCHKVAGIFTVRVAGRGTTQSVDLVDDATGAPRGRVALRGGKCDRVRVGSVLRVEGMGLTDEGKIREPKPCREWLVKF